MKLDTIGAMLGSAIVTTSNDGGLGVDHWSERLADNIISVSDTAPAPIRDQAMAFKDGIKPAIRHYMQAACDSRVTTIIAHLEKAGHRDLADIIRRM